MRRFNNREKQQALLTVMLGVIFSFCFLAAGIHAGNTPSSPDKETLREFLRSGEYLLLKYDVFDPVADPPEQKTRFTPKGKSPETRYYILQFKDRIKSSWRQTLEAEGIRLLGYIPCNAYVGYLDIYPPENLKRFDFLRWSGPYLPCFKVDPTLSGRLRLPDSDDTLSVTLTTFPGITVETLLASPVWTGTGVDIFAAHDSLLGRGTMHCRIPADQRGWKLLVKMANLEGVEWIEPFEPAVSENNHSIWVVQSGNPVTRATPLFDNALTGIGQIYGSLDIGVDTDACQMRYSNDPGAQTFLNDTQPPDVNITDPGHKIITYYLLDGALPYDSYQSGYHGTHTAGCAVGDNYASLATLTDPGRDGGDGMAPGARMVFQDAGAYGNELPGLNYASITNIHQQAYDSGARIHNNSYGATAPSTVYSAFARDTDEVLWRLRDYLIFYSAGNQGPASGTLTGSGKIAKNCIAAGASRNGAQNDAVDMYENSSHGPTADFRLKPELVAPGENIMSATETMPVSGLSTTDPPNNNCAQSRLSGTSYASATAAGAALLVRQYFVDGYYPGGQRNYNDTLTPSNALLKAIMINSCINMPGAYTADNGAGGASAVRPTFGQGWGRLTLDRSLYFTGDERRLIILEDAWNGEAENQGHGPFPGRAITTDEVHLFGIEQQSHFQNQPLQITLVWSDPAGSPGAQAALVNNLDLVVTGPRGQMYVGNANFSDGFSEPASPSQSDYLNPVENIFILSPETGIYTIQVRGTHVPGNGTSHPFRSDLQGYALLVTGSHISRTEPGIGHFIVTGPGPDSRNDTAIRVFDGEGAPVGGIDFLAYASYGYGANVAGGDVNADGTDEIITGPGKGESVPPLVRAFTPAGTILPGGEFMAYGIHKYGVQVACGDIDGDGVSEVLTGPGPGAVFGPHIRGWKYLSDTFNPLPQVNFMAYGTGKFGAKPAAGDIDGDLFFEILTAPGPGAVFAPHIRGWNYDARDLEPMSDINFFAYGTRKWGANVSTGDIDGDAFAEILTGAGPGAVFGPHVRGWNYDDTVLAALSKVSYFAYGTRKMGVQVAAGDLDLDGFAEIISGPGPGNMFGPHVRGWNYDNQEISLSSANFFAYNSSLYRFGVNISAVSSRAFPTLPF